MNTTQLPQATRQVFAVRPPRLLDQVARQRGASEPTTAQLTARVRAYVLFHGKRHPREMAAAEVEQFLTHLAVHGRVSASTQNQALNALVFLYQQVLEIDLGRFETVRARWPKRMPVVLAPDEVAAVLAHVEGGGGVFRLMARLLYGCGLRLLECCREDRGRKSPGVQAHVTVLSEPLLGANEQRPLR